MYLELPTKEREMCRPREHDRMEGSGDGRGWQGGGGRKGGRGGGGYWATVVDTTKLRGASLQELTHSGWEKEPTTKPMPELGCGLGPRGGGDKFF